MNRQTPIEAVSDRWAPVLTGQQPVACKEQHIPGAINYSIKRFMRDEEQVSEDIGIVHYDYKGKSNEENSVKLRFCVAGNMYCAAESCQKCTAGNSKGCAQSIPSYDVVSVDYSAPQLSKFVSSKAGNCSTDVLLRFNKKDSFQKSMPLCCKTRGIIEALVNHKYTGSLENIYINAQLQMLLLHSIDWISDKGEMLSCRFLNSDIDREKITLARDILIQSIGQPVTIK